MTSLVGASLVNHLHRSARAALLSAAVVVLIWAGSFGTAFATGYGVGGYVTLFGGSCPIPSDPSHQCFEAGQGPTAQDPIGPNQPALSSPSAPVYALSGPTLASASLTVTTDPFVAGNGFAEADLAAGTLRVFAQTGQSMLLAAGFSDTLTPLADGVVHFDITIDGTKNPGVGGIVGNALIDAGVFFAIDNTVLKGVLGEYDSDNCIHGDSFGGGSLFGAVSCGYAFDVAVAAGVPFRVTTTLVANVTNSTLDLANTLVLRATGVSFTSDSGVFLTAVPEPGLVWLLGATLAGLAWRRR